jgi:hypothetical protein
MDCGEGQTVSIVSAVWGRTDKFGGEQTHPREESCGRDRMAGVQADTCKFDVREQLAGHCNGKRVCNFDEAMSSIATTLNFVEAPDVITEACMNTLKYLNYTYACVNQ